MTPQEMATLKRLQKKHDALVQRGYITITKDMSMSDRMSVSPALGRILPVDIGKRVYFVNGHAQVESQKQFKKRTQGVIA